MKTIHQTQSTFRNLIFPFIKLDYHNSHEICSSCKAQEPVPATIKFLKIAVNYAIEKPSIACFNPYTSKGDRI